MMRFGHCDICKINEAEYDCKLAAGPWAYCCPTCFQRYGVGLGVGKGQKLSEQRQTKTTKDGGN